MNLIQPALRVISSKGDHLALLAIGRGELNALNEAKVSPVKRSFWPFKKAAPASISTALRSGFPTHLARYSTTLEKEGFPAFHRLLKLHWQTFEILRQDVSVVWSQARKDYPTNAEVFVTEHLAFNDFSVRANRLYAALLDPNYTDNASTNRAVNAEIELLLFSATEIMRNINRILKVWRREEKVRRDAEKMENEIEFKHRHGEAFTVFRP